MNKRMKSTLFELAALPLMMGCSGPYGLEERPKEDYHFEPGAPHQDKGAVGKPVKKGAGRRLSKAQRKKLYGKGKKHESKTFRNIYRRVA